MKVKNKDLERMVEIINYSIQDARDLVTVRSCRISDPQFTLIVTAQGEQQFPPRLGQCHLRPCDTAIDRTPQLTPVVSDELGIDDISIHSGLLYPIDFVIGIGSERMQRAEPLCGSSALQDEIVLLS